MQIFINIYYYIKNNNYRQINNINLIYRALEGKPSIGFLRLSPGPSSSFRFYLGLGFWARSHPAKMLRRLVLHFASITSVAFRPPEKILVLGCVEGSLFPNPRFQASSSSFIDLHQVLPIPIFPHCLLLASAIRSASQCGWSLDIFFSVQIGSKGAMTKGLPRMWVSFFLMAMTIPFFPRCVV